VNGEREMVNGLEQEPLNKIFDLRLFPFTIHHLPFTTNKAKPC